MNHQPNDIAALTGSRICHDLISPLGAIANGLELLELTGVSGPELDLIRESVESANARVKLFRIAFGAAGDGQMTPAREVRALLGEGAPPRKTVIDWQPDDDLPRREVKLALLGVMCLESALPFGGRITVARDMAGAWTLEAQSDRLKSDPDLWLQVEAPGTTPLPAAAQLHFVLLGPELALQGRDARVERRADALRLSF